MSKYVVLGATPLAESILHAPRRHARHLFSFTHRKSVVSVYFTLREAAPRVEEEEEEEDGEEGGKKKEERSSINIQ